MTGVNIKKRKTKQINISMWKKRLKRSIPSVLVGSSGGQFWGDWCQKESLNKLTLACGIREVNMPENIEEEVNTFSSEGKFW